MADSHFHWEEGSETALLVLTTAAKQLKGSLWGYLETINGSHITEPGHLFSLPE